MMATSKDGWCNKSDAEILNSLRDWVLRCDLKYSKREALKKIDSAFALWGGADYVAAVHLLDENEVYFSKEDWPYYALGIEILKARQYTHFYE